MNLMRVNPRVSFRAVLITSLAWVVLGAAIALDVSPAHAQRLDYAQTGTPPDPGLELLQEEPHDILYFTDAAGGGWARVLPLDFPGRKPPSKPTGSLRFRVLGIEGKEMVAKWSTIDKIDLWEVKLEKETRDRIAAGDFVGAYPFLSVLIRDFPNQKGLRELRSNFLWQDAISRAKKGEIAPTLAMLEELRRYAPEFQGSTVVRALSGTADRLMQVLVDSGQLDLAQQMLSRLKVDYENDRLDAIKKWDQKFFDMASAKRDEAEKARDAKDYRLARKLAREALYLQPDLPGGMSLVRQIHDLYPMVNVGVLQSATVLEPTRIDNWAARRAGRLMYRTLFEIQGAGPEGGEYDFIFGETEMSPDRMHFELLIEPEKIKPPLDKIRGFYLADVMADRAIPTRPEYFAPWAAAVESIELIGPTQVGFNLAGPTCCRSVCCKFPSTEAGSAVNRIRPPVTTSRRRWQMGTTLDLPPEKRPPEKRPPKIPWMSFGTCCETSPGRRPNHASWSRCE